MPNHYIRFANEEAYREFHKQVEWLYQFIQININDSSHYKGLSEDAIQAKHKELEHFNRVLWDKVWDDVAELYDRYGDIS